MSESCGLDEIALAGRPSSGRVFKMDRRDASKASVDIVPVAAGQKQVLANLLELYSHDFSEFIPLEIGPEGRFGYRDLDLYWTDPQRLPYFIYADGKLAGFALVQRIAQDGEAVWDVAEFFVMRGWRGKGVGVRAAMEIFARLPGGWQVRVMRLNRPAVAFWMRTVKEFAGEDFFLSYATAQGKEWMLLSFQSPSTR